MTSTLLLLVSLLLTLSSTAFSVPTKRAAISPGFPYGSQKVRGVNLGNTAIIDEWTFCEYQSTNAVKAALKKHWATWITESDFRDIAAAGLNHVRLPIGFWAWDISGGEPYVQGQLDYMYKAVSWARAYGLRLIIDLHGAPGSQNGYSHSGHTGTPEWQHSQSNIDRTNAIIKKIVAQFADQTNVVPVIGALNEPTGWDNPQSLDVIRQYWHDSYGNVRRPYGTSQQSNLVLMIHDAFQPFSFWKDFMPPPQWEGVMMDTHLYQMFRLDKITRSDDQKISDTCNVGNRLSSFHLWTVVGEWTATGDDCAKYLNGRGRGTRWEGTLDGSSRIGSCNGLTGDASKFSTSRKTFLRKFWEAQAMTYERGAGWIQWTWKAAAEEWSYKSGLEHGWIPRNPTDYRYPNICS